MSENPMSSTSMTMMFGLAAEVCAWAEAVTAETAMARSIAFIVFMVVSAY
jgi:hypothetical protein